MFSPSVRDLQYDSLLDNTALGCSKGFNPKLNQHAHGLS